MIGILCNSSDVDLFRDFVEKNAKDEEILIFNIQDLDYEKNNVKGILVKKDIIIYDYFKIPNIIFNFSIQHDRLNIKKLRSLVEDENIKIFNSSNNINQYMIYEILNSNEVFKPYLMSYSVIDKDTVLLEADSIKNNIIIPIKGTKKFIYIEKLGEYYEIYKENDIERVLKIGLKNSLNRLLKKKRFLVINSPKLIKKNYPFIFRIILQSGKLQSLILNGEPLLEEYSLSPNIKKLVEAISIKMFDYIKNFLPNLFLIYFDFIFDLSENPYFLRMGGAEIRLFNDERKKYIYENIIELSLTLE
ncbi:MAG: hypothetical protein N2486_00065 [Caloramator sp.]|nr:hypothetical protein [Caloramator sp.]